MQRIKAWLRHYFGFTSKESKGFLAMLLVLAFLLALHTFFDLIIPTQPNIHTEIKELKADSALQAMELEVGEKKSKATLFVFDPNNASQKDFVKLGLPYFIAQRIVHYREKGGRFKKKEDLAKIYGLRPSDYQRLMPYIQLQKLENEQKKTFSNTSISSIKKPERPIHLNLADTTDLKKVNGIGTTLAARIVKYRTKLGGFANSNQLYEVFGLDTAVVKQVLSKCILPNSEGLKILAINTLPADSLSQHPYLGKKAAKILVNYRQHHGKFSSKEDLLKSKAIAPEKIDKLMPYLSF
jgi:DNA uptake protein ComE-like DNA-binding protein